MARWHKRLPPPLTIPPFPRVCCHCLCVSTCLVTHTHRHTLNRAKMAQRSQRTMSAPHGAAFRALHVFVSVCLRECLCVVRECGLCHVRHFVTYFLSFVSCVFASFSASLVSGDSSSSSLHVTHTHILLQSGFVAKCVAVSLCVCVFQKMLHCFWHARRHRDSFSLTPTLRHALKSTLTHTHTLLRINQLKKVLGVATPGWLTGVCCCHFCCNFMATFITFICIFTSWIVFVALLLCLTWEFYERLTPCPSCSATDMHGSKMNF